MRSKEEPQTPHLQRSVVALPPKLIVAAIIGNSRLLGKLNLKIWRLKICILNRICPREASLPCLWFILFQLALPIERTLSYSLITSHYSRDHLFLCNFNSAFICLQIWIETFSGVGATGLLQPAMSEMKRIQLLLGNIQIIFNIALPREKKKMQEEKPVKQLLVF